MQIDKCDDNDNVEQISNFVLGNLVSNIPESDFTGIYVFYNSRYFYVGQSINVRKRLRQHQNHLLQNKHENVIVQRVYNKYKDIDPFVFKPILQCNIDDLNYFEDYCFETLKSLNANFTPMNIAKCGEAGDIAASRISKSKAFRGILHPWKYVKYVQLDKEGNLIKIWDSLAEAQRQYGIINPRKHTSQGYQWQKYDEYLTLPKGKVKHKHNIDDTVKQFDLQGNLIAEYTSIKEACKITGVNKSTLNSCLKGKGKTAGGFLWSYGECPKIIIKSRYVAPKKKVLQYDLNGNYIKTFSTLNKAASEIGITNYAIKRNIEGYTKNAGGYIWKYEK